MENLIAYVLLYIVGVLLLIFAARWIFLIDKQIRISQAQLKMLAEIAAKSGVDHKRINIILYVADTGVMPRDSAKSVPA